MSSKRLLALLLVFITAFLITFYAIGPVQLVIRKDSYSTQVINQLYPPGYHNLTIPCHQSAKINHTHVDLPAQKRAKPLILLYHVLHGAPNWWFKTTEQDFASCPIKCQVTNNRSLYSQADMVMFECPRFIKKQEGERIYLEYFRDWGEWPTTRGNEQQVRMFFAREPQAAGLSGDGLEFAKFMFNYTTTFQKEADIFYPYGHSMKLSQVNGGTLPDYGLKKTKLVLWIVSNCYARHRMQYKEDLQQYVPVDMFGGCNKTHGDPCHRSYKCLIDLKLQYKFYLAFENHRCEEYITEKFWKALNEGMVPIAMGPTREIYEKVAPPHSFIHVDDFTSPKELSEYLKILDHNNTMYNEYHNWRRSYSIAWENANCAICRLASEKPQKVTDITKMWNTRTQCTI